MKSFLIFAFLFFYMVMSSFVLFLLVFLSKEEIQSLTFSVFGSLFFWLNSSWTDLFKQLVFFSSCQHSIFIDEFSLYKFFILAYHVQGFRERVGWCWLNWLFYLLLVVSFLNELVNLCFCKFVIWVYEVRLHIFFFIWICVSGFEFLNVLVCIF